MSGIDLMEKSDIFAKLKFGIQNFSSQQQKFCSYVEENYRDAAFLTIQSISTKLQIGSATVMRTIRNLGYVGYKDFTTDLRKHIINQESTYWRELRESWKKDDVLKPSLNKLTEITQANIQNLENSLTPFILQSFSEAVTLLKKARRICILGLRSSRAASYYFYYILNECMNNIILADALDSSEIYSNLVNLTPDDVFVAISLGGPNYAARTHEAINYVHSRKVPIVLITSDARNQSAPLAQSLLLIVSPQYHYSLVSVMNLLDALVANLGIRCNKDRMQELASIVTQSKIVL